MTGFVRSAAAGGRWLCRSHWRAILALSKLDRSIQGFLTALAQVLFSGFPATLYLVIAVAVMWRRNHPLTFLAVCFAPLPAIIAVLAAPEQTRRDMQEQLGDRSDALTLPDIREQVEFENVRFHYEAATANLDGVSFGAELGEAIAMEGPSGSGKATLTSLLMRFYDPCEGIVRIDGIDLHTVKQSSLLRQIGVVLQEPLLFNDTVRANIAYRRPEASLPKIIAAAQAANAHQFIRQLPEGYDTLLGDRGGRLSAGERQRLAIARALLKDPPLIILDEATSWLDAESEAVVHEALEHLMQSRTAFVIAQRLATVVNAGQILVLKEGRIIECAVIASCSTTPATTLRLPAGKCAVYSPTMTNEAIRSPPSPERRRMRRLCSFMVPFGRSLK